VSIAIGPLVDAEIEQAVALWREAGLTRPWNDPLVDARLALSNPTSTILAARDDDRLLATVMVGFDGHRAWVYYLAAAASERRSGLGRRMMQAAEEWARDLGAPKIELMVRDTNKAAAGFYEALGYKREPVAVFSRWLTPEGWPPRLT
jgi:ribosomal protein S18 acetylase RimI-like enzyme